MLTRLAYRIHTTLERYLPEQRLFLKSEHATRFVRLRPATQLLLLVGGGALITWTFLASSILLMPVTLIGFAAETNDTIANAREKLSKKGLDMIVANDVSQAGAGFNTDTNIVKFLYPDGTVESLDMMTKDDVALRLLDRVMERRER